MNIKHNSKKLRKKFELALKYFNLGDLRQADSICCEVLQKNPTHADTLHLYGLLAHRLGRYTIATDIFRQAITYKAGSAVFHYNLGLSLLANGKRSEANEAFEVAVTLKPDYLNAVRDLANSLEQSNNLESCKDVINRGFEVFPDDPHLMLTLSKLERRSGNHGGVVDVLKTALLKKHQMTDLLKGEIYLILGQAYDRLNNHDMAFQYFTDGNRFTANEGNRLGYSKHNYNRLIDELKAAVTPDLANIRSSIMDSSFSPRPPVFLVGFPRSGTTLLDQILNSHPDIVTIEEKPTVDVIHEDYYRLQQGNLPKLSTLNIDQINGMQRDYFLGRNNYAPDDGRLTIIDKMPLNSWRAPLLWRVFNDAKFILAIRHPCDVCLSCFMQCFTVNDAMSNFFTLADAVEFYDKVMSSWIEYVNLLPLNYQMIRYEDLINDVEGESRKIVDFLGVNWNDELLRHTDNASKRKAINTPSYHQVTQPIYKHAEYRWKKYEKHFEPYMNTLSYYIDYFGYST